ncbi:ABC transporter substrate-binding protein [Bordetella sp. BOR01]|uniref:ABC transporter substrate-binding protein n=1 Tax=Bordetella sp. BOR01 TaxID=2854779 RepID=UPI001C467C97|nr:ABC transporter substrate-binding protein [Bordetella sp. BOR01]MBV7483424.1 ABC transporter substrate-binding protein [Bordetella sp. BOR01]
MRFAKLLAILSILFLAIPLRAGAQGRDLKSLDIAIVGGASATYWDIFAAQALGYYRDAGIDLKITSIDTGSKAAQGLVTSAVHLASLPAEVAISAIEKGAGLAIIGAETARPHFSFVVSKDIDGYEQLRGKTIAVSQLAEAGATILRKLLAQHGVLPGEYNIIQLGGNSNRMTGLIKGAIDATFLSPPLDFRAESEIGAQRLGYLYEVFENPYMVYTVQSDWAEKNPDLVAAFLRATIRSARWLFDPANREQAIDVLVRARTATSEDAAKTYDLFFGSRAIQARDAAIEPQHIQAYLDLRGGGPLGPDAFLDLRYRAQALTGLQ